MDHRFNPTDEQTTLGVPELDVFADQGLITRIHSQLTSGKEATVYCCKAHPSTRRRYVAAKVYRPYVSSAYRRGATYFEGRERVMKAREMRALQAGTEYGRRIASGLWVQAEFENLKRVATIDAAIPRPLAMNGRAILMEYVGNGERPAPQLHGAGMEEETAHAVFRQILDAITQLLSIDLVHADLSPYNILYWQEQAWIIDLPQAVDARFNHSAQALLQRDLENLAAFFARYGVEVSPRELTQNLWSRYQRAQL